MPDMPDIVRTDLQGIPESELDAAQVGRKRIRQRDDHDIIDSYAQPTRRDYEC